MSQNQLVQARISGEVKEQATAALAAVGLTVSDAVRILLTRVAQEKIMPFDLFIPNRSTITAIEDARKEKLETVTLDEIRATLRAHD